MINHRALISFFLDLLTFKSNRKIIVIESDDWGSIRMPSKKVYDALIKKGIRVDKIPYNRFDALASEDDLSLLFEVLSSVKDKHSNSAVITANTIVGNPNFDKIRETEFTEYHYEPFTQTQKRYPEHKNSFELWEQGISNHIFHPQLHGREHINVNRWMNALRKNAGNVRLAFDYGMYDLSDDIIQTADSYMDAFNFTNLSEIEFQKKSILEGAELFETIFGYRSKTFIAPCYKWSSKLNKTFKASGVNCFQGNYIQLEPKEGEKHKFKKKIHYIGQTNNLDQRFLVRNVEFEPSQNQKKDYVDEALAQIQKLFQNNKPAIICSHRINFIGYIDPKNRDRNLPQFKRLLSEIVKRWPNVEFMTSDQLYELIKKNN